MLSFPMSVMLFVLRYRYSYSQIYVQGNVYEMEEGFRYGNVHVYRELQNVSILRCISVCGCSTVNYNKGFASCELVSPSATVSDRVPVAGWRVYSKVVQLEVTTTTVPTTAAGPSYISAWQSTTAHGGDAARAIDGNTNQRYHAGSCSHTADTTNNYWAMEMNAYVQVKSVEIYFRDDSKNNRNRAIQILVAASRYDIDNDIATVCGWYDGPPLNPTIPVVVACGGSVYGQFVKIKQSYHESVALQLCEVMVHS